MPGYDPNRHHRRSIRLPGWDYRQGGAYFVTIATHERAHLFGKVVDGAMAVSDFGQIAVEEWERTAQLRPYVRLDAFMVMPNHVHGIVWIVDGDAVGAQRRCAPTPTNVLPRSLGAIIRAFKSIVTRRINQIRSTPGAPVWQRNYYEHIVRNERELNAVREYIQNNPVNWPADTENV
jgi:putative transposase